MLDNLSLKLDAKKAAMDCHNREFLQPKDFGTHFLLGEKTWRTAKREYGAASKEG